MDNVVYKIRGSHGALAEFEIFNIDVKDDAILALVVTQGEKQLDFDMSLRELKIFQTYINRCINYIEEEQSKL